MASSLHYKAVLPGHQQAIEDNTPNLLLWGPGGSGKSEILAVKGILVGETFPGSKIAFVRRKGVDLYSTLWARFIERLPEGLIEHQTDKPMYVKTKNGTQYFGFGFDSIKDVNKFASAEYTMVIIEEANEIPEEYFDEKIRRACRYPGVPFNQNLLACNPDAPAHWINSRFILHLQPDHRNIFLPTIPESTGIMPPSFYRYLESLTGVFAQRYREGKWVAVEGLVYPFDPTHHIISREEFMRRTGVRREDNKWLFPEDSKFVGDIDFGYDNPFCAQWWYISPNDIWFRYREIYMTNRRVEIHTKDINNLCRQDIVIIGEGKQKQEKVIYPEFICDHDSENIADLKAGGLKTKKAIKERLAGQQSVQKLFDTDRIFYVENSLVEKDYNLVMKKQPTCSEEEYSLYTWGDSKTKEDMIKQHDHGKDAERYGIHTTTRKSAVPKITVASVGGEAIKPDWNRGWKNVGGSDEE